MKKVGILALLLLFLMAATVSAQDKGPAAVSPASEMGIAKVGQLCPTFSWTAVDWAEVYRVEIYKAMEGEVPDHNNMAAASNPVLVKEILGAATSWTPSTDEQLNRNDIYVWYVQGIDESGNGVWSQGRFFQIEVALGLAPIEEALNETLEEHGVDRGVIDDVIDRVRNKASGGTGGGALVSGDQPIFSIMSGTEDTWRTRLGLFAGTQNTSSTGSHNAYLGYAAGYRNITGDQNVFLGHYAGYWTNGASWNTMVGYQAGYLNTTGYDNTFIGIRAGDTTTTGFRNTYIGGLAGDNNVSGDYNVMVGYAAGQRNLTDGNTFIGSWAGYQNTSGAGNVALGYLAGQGNATGQQNTFVGYRAGNTTTASYNTMLGYYSGFANTSGYDNTFVGIYAGDSNTTGIRNTFIGRQAGQANLTGHYNVFMGYQSGYSATGGNSTFIGSFAGDSTTTGNYNTFLGYAAGQANVTGGSNTYLGYAAGYLSTGTGNVHLGHHAGYNNTSSNKLFIDNSSTSDPLIWGDFSTNTVSLMGTVGIGTKTPAFPMEMKKTGTNASIVVDRTDGATNYINATDTSGNFGTVTNHVLRLVVNSTWRMRLHTDDSMTMRNGASCSAGGTWLNASSRDLKENIRELDSEDAFSALENLNPVQYNYKADKEEDYIGFIAEDVPDLVATKDKKSMATMDVVAVLTKVVQEQQKLAEKQQKTIEELQKKIEKLEKK